MEKFKEVLSTVGFIVAETILIWLIGEFLELDVNHIWMVILIFIITRAALGKVLHFEKWYKCLVYCLLIFLSLFLTLKVNIILCVLFTVFAGFIMTGKSTLIDVYCWTGRNSKYDALRKFVSYTPNNPIILDHENYWRTNYPLRYKIFQLYFREQKTYDEIRRIEDLPDNTIIKKECATIYSILERPLGLPPIIKPKD